MRLPHVIPSHAFDAFKCSEETQLLPAELARTLRAEDETWDEGGYAMIDGRQQRRGQQPKDLKALSLSVIAENWKNKPLLHELPTDVDRDYLVEILPLDLSFEFAIKAMPYEHYWRRASEARWRFVDPSAHGNSWLRLYCERHLTEWLESLDPMTASIRNDMESSESKALSSDMPIEQPPQLSRDCENLLELLRDHVRTVKIRQLMPFRGEPIRTAAPKEGEEINEIDYAATLKEPEVHHLPMDLVLGMLPHVREVHMNVGMVFKIDGVEWQDFTFSMEDSRKIGRGLRALAHLSKFSLTRSCLDRPRVAAILQGLAVSRSIEEIDFSHCKLGDEGAHAIGAFLSRRARIGRLKVLRLVNNGIGPSGIAGLVRGLLLPTGADNDDDHDDLDDDERYGEESGNPELQRTLAKIDLRLNPIGDEGAKHLAALLLRHPMQYLNISGCNMKTEGGMALAQVLSSTKISKNLLPGLEFIFSNNDFGTIVGEAFEIVAKSCGAICKFDVRMCGFLKESEFSIASSVARNAKSWKRDRSRLCRSDSRRQSSLGAQSMIGVERVSSLVPPKEFQEFQKPRIPESPERRNNIESYGIVLYSNDDVDDDDDDDDDDEGVEAEEDEESGQ